ncbi:MAG: hypothetical protein ACYTBX_18130 [Planctomycetota bacterium]|jgi:hypothetical protein
MKKYEVAAIVLLVLFVISSISTGLYTILLSRLYGPDVVSKLSLHQHAMLNVQRLLKVLGSIAVAVWLAREAKRDGFSVPVWALFGLFFSILGAILYFVLRSQADHSTDLGELDVVGKGSS